MGGWLRRLGCGVYLLSGDELNRDASLAWLGTQVPGLHVAGKNALRWRGVRHNLAFTERLVLWGDVPTALPAWFTAAFPLAYQATHLFDEALPAGLGRAPLPGCCSDLLVSAPERAAPEFLSDVGTSQSLEEARHLAEGTRAAPGRSWTPCWPMRSPKNWTCPGRRAAMGVGHQDRGTSPPGAALMNAGDASSAEDTNVTATVPGTLPSAG